MLLDGLADQGVAAAQKIDQAAQDMLDGITERARVEQATFQLLSLVHQPRPGDVQRSRSERLAAEADRLLREGGEQPPTVLVRPGQPRHVMPAAADEQVAVPA